MGSGRTDDAAPAEQGALPTMGARPAVDPLAKAVARARVTSTLLGIDERVKLGRYHLLERAGVGGMGVVYAAWDPELDRRVAIKIMHVDVGALRERVMAEGQALAKLSHPNVIAVHDVGLFEENVFLVMEWVRGRNLRAFGAEPHALRDVLAVYRAAGEGLLAAHRANLVHRDFKPENVMIDDGDGPVRDRRVRVLDFGLARAELDPHGGVAGTPRYMAPEQQRGEPVTGAADQFAFCVALREAIVGRDGAGKTAPIPSWLAAICARGTIEDPTQRFADMAALLRALAHDPATVWRRRGLVAAALGITATAFAVGTLRASNTDAPFATCTGATEEVAASWNAARRDGVVGHLRSLGAYGAGEAERIATQLDDHATRWSTAHRSACVAHRRGEVTPQLYERGLGCLARSRVALETVADALGRVTVERLPDAMVAARGLPESEHCLRDTAASTIAAPPAAIAREVEAVSADLTRTSYLVLAGDPAAAATARTAAATADRLGHSPLIARAQLALGTALASDRAQLAVAIASYERAAAAAIASNDDDTFVEAYARELFLVGRSPRDQLAPEVADLAASLRWVAGIAERTGPLGSFSRALLFNNAGTTRLAAGDPAGARQWFRQAYEVPRSGPRAIELWAVVGNLASTTSDATERSRLFAEQRTHLERELGPHHLFTLAERVRAQQFTADTAVVARELDELCTALVRWHPHRRDKIEPCAYELAAIARDRGNAPKRAAALAMIGESADAQSRLARATRQLLAGDARGAAAEAARIAEETALAKPWWARFWSVEAWLVEAEAWLAANDRTRAHAAAKRALDMLAEPGFDLSLVFLQRRAARARVLLEK